MAYDLIGQLIAYETDGLDEEQTIELFQHLVDTGMAWTLQGSYGRQAYAMAQRGLIKIPEGSKDYWGNTIKV